MFECIRQFFGLGQTEMPPALPPHDLDVPNAPWVTTKSRLTPDQFEKLRVALAAPLPNTTHKPPRKRVGKARRAGKSKRRAA